MQCSFSILLPSKLFINLYEKVWYKTGNWDIIIVFNHRNTIHFSIQTCNYHCNTDVVRVEGCWSIRHLGALSFKYLPFIYKKFNLKMTCLHEFPDSPLLYSFALIWYAKKIHNSQGGRSYNISKRVSNIRATLLMQVSAERRWKFRSGHLICTDKVKLFCNCFKTHKSKHVYTVEWAKCALLWCLSVIKQGQLTFVSPN